MTRPGTSGCSEPPALEAVGLGRMFGDRVGLPGIDLAARPGELVGLVGRSGAGKTTLLRLLYGALRPSQGRLTVLGRDMLRQSPAGLRGLRRRIAVVPQAHGLVPTLSAAQNVAIGLAGRSGWVGALRVAGRLGPRERTAAHAALARVGIAGLLDERVERLSGGEQQRVAVARALIQEADVLLADEPVASVDAVTAGRLMEVLAEEAGSGCCVLVSLHQAGLAARHCSRVIELGAGAAPS